MNEKKHSSKATWITLLIVGLLCVGLILVSYFLPNVASVIRGGVQTALEPLQKSMNLVGEEVSGHVETIRDLYDLEAENARLREELSYYQAENAQLVGEASEAEELRALLELSDRYPDYETIGARVIGSNSGNWYATFLIDKGSEDGIAVDMNVLAGGGLCGIVTEVGPHTATVRSIIDNYSNVSAVFLSTQTPCFVQGDLELYQEGMLSIAHIDKSMELDEETTIVTANNSEKFLPGILIGYAVDLKEDANNLTLSGHLIPVVNFEYIENVLVITTLKEAEE